jgi:1,3-beta-glucanosyltransferase GAS3
MRQYISLHSPRHIPVGYSAADVRDVLEDTYNYLSCSIDGSGNDPTSQEFFGLNSYSWCGATATFESSGYNTLVSMFAGASSPVFFSEYGCNQPPGQPRVFNEVQALYGTQMTGLNGGLVYEWSEEANDFGLVTINADGSVNILADYDNLQGQYNKLSASTLTTVPSVSNTAPKCDASLITTTGFSTNWTLPDQPPGAAALIQNGASNPVSGKIVPVTNTVVSQKVYSSSGKLLTGLQLNSVSGSNTPSGQNTSSGQVGNGTSGGKKGAASSTSQVSSALLGVAAIVGAMFAML